MREFRHNKLSEKQGGSYAVREPEFSFIENVATDRGLAQLDFVHAERETIFKLWGEGMEKEQRDIVSMENTIPVLPRDHSAGHLYGSHATHVSHPSPLLKYSDF